MKLKLNWVRAQATETIEVMADNTGSVRRREIIEMPTFKGDLSKYSGEAKGDIAVIVPIYDSQLIGKNTYSQYSNEAYCKRVFWQVWELLKYTRLQEYGIPYYIVCTEEGRKLLEPYRALCGFPKDNIIVMEGINDETSPGYAQQTDLFLEFANRFDFQYIFVMHASVFFFQPPEGSPAFWEEVRSCLKTHPDKLHFRHKFLAEAPLSFRFLHIRGLYGAENILSEAEFYQKLADYTDQKFGSIHHFIQFWSQYRAQICSGTFILKRSRIHSDEFQDVVGFLKNEIPYMFEEGLFNLYWQKYCNADEDILYWDEVLRWSFPAGLYHDEKLVTESHGYLGVVIRMFKKYQSDAWCNYYNNLAKEV